MIRAGAPSPDARREGLDADGRDRGLRPIPPSLLRALDLRIRRRVDALVPGDFRSLFVGEGVELAQIRPYIVGDDVRAIDWNVTARIGQPHVRLRVAERALTTWLLLDVSASMSFGTQDRTKAEVANGAVLAISYLATTGANRLGTIAFSHGAQVALRPTGDRRRVMHLLESIADGERRGGGPTTLDAAFRYAERVSRRPGAVVVVSDLRGPIEWRRSLSRLSQRHHVLVLEVLDEREQRLVAGGVMAFSDPETGRELRVDTSDPALRRAFADAADAERASVRHAVRASGAEHVALQTSGDWLRSLAVFLNKRRRVR
jgi:uncharacterized protein (DUF58 family)